MGELQELGFLFSSHVAEISVNHLPWDICIIKKFCDSLGFSNQISVILTVVIHEMAASLNKF